MDVDPQDEELADLLVDLRPRKCDPARHRELLRKGMRAVDRRAQQIFKQTRLDALAQGMADGQFGHVILLLAQADEVVVDARLVLARVVEVEVFRLDVCRGQFFRLEFGDVVQEPFFLREGHAPDDDGAVVEEEDFWGVDAGVEVQVGFVGEVVVVVGVGW